MLVFDGGEMQAHQRLRPSWRHVVAAEIDTAVLPLAHAVGDVGDLTATHGMALCGLPVEALVVVPDLQWRQVDGLSRCGLCEEAMSAGS